MEQSYIIPGAVHHLALGGDSNQIVGCHELVVVSVLLVGEEKVGHPDFSRIGQQHVILLIFYKNTCITYLKKK
jgi:hypothetical protein